MKSFQKFHNYDRKGTGCQLSILLRVDPSDATSLRPKRQDLAAGWVNPKIPEEGWRNPQKRVVDKASSALNLEEKALKITLKTQS